MNPFRLLCLGLLFFASGRASAIPFGPPLNVRRPPTRLPTVLETQPAQTDFGKLDGGGRLFFQELDPLWTSTYTYFPRGKRYGIQLHHDPSRMNTFLAAEVRRPQTARKFIEEYFVKFLTSNFSDYGVVIASKQMAQYDADLRPLALPSRPVVTGNTWTLELNVITWAGAVQHWRFKGQVLPLRIDSFQCEARKPEGTFPGVVLTR